jgi:hypothetical protein
LGGIKLKEKQFNTWSKYRKVGRKKYILLWGLYFIVLMILINAVIDLVQGKAVFNIPNIITTIIIGGVAGVYAGWASWRNSETRYQEHIKQKK